MGAQPSTEQVVATLLDRYGHQSLVERADVPLQDSPNNVFQVLELALLEDARVHPDTAADAFLRLRDRGWTTAKGMVDADRGEVVDVLRGLEYPDPDADRIATGLSDAALHVLHDHGGDPGGIRQDAGANPQREREELTRFVGVRDRSVDNFFEEIQLLWPELRPFADKATLDAADRLALGGDAATLRGNVDSDEAFVRVVDALQRTREEEDGVEQVRQAAAGS